jgi:hypothetical protein
MSFCERKEFLGVTGKLHDRSDYRNRSSSLFFIGGIGERDERLLLNMRELLDPSFLLLNFFLVVGCGWSSVNQEEGFDSCLEVNDGKIIIDNLKMN